MTQCAAIDLSQYPCRLTLLSVYPSSIVISFYLSKCSCRLTRFSIYRITQVISIYRTSHVMSFDLSSFPCRLTLLSNPIPMSLHSIYPSSHVISLRLSQYPSPHFYFLEHFRWAASPLSHVIISSVSLILLWCFRQWLVLMFPSVPRFLCVSNQSLMTPRLPFWLNFHLSPANLISYFTLASSSMMVCTYVSYPASCDALISNWCPHDYLCN